MKPNVNALFWSQPTRLRISMTEPTPSPAEETLIPYTQRQLMQRALTNLPKIARPARDTPMWKLVKELFDCGEDVAHRICWRNGFDPDGVCRKSTRGPWFPWEDRDDGK